MDYYRIFTNIAFNPLTLIDLPELINKAKDNWFNQTLCQVNKCVVRLGVVKGEFHWHKHEESDEFFLNLEGKLIIETKENKIELLPFQGFLVPRGILHKTSAKERTVILMIGESTINPRGTRELSS